MLVGWLVGSLRGYCEGCGHDCIVGGDCDLCGCDHLLGGVDVCYGHEFYPGTRFARVDFSANFNPFCPTYP